MVHEFEGEVFEGVAAENAEEDEGKGEANAEFREKFEQADFFVALTAFAAENEPGEDRNIVIPF